MLPTGSGKTLIGCALMHHVLMPGHRDIRGKALFLVPTIPLVQQQADAIRPCFPPQCRIAQLHGARSKQGDTVAHDKVAHDKVAHAARALTLHETWRVTGGGGDQLGTSAAAAAVAHSPLSRRHDDWNILVATPPY